MNIIFILGMHRSGTSALTRVFNIMGMGVPKTLMSANEFNQTGYWESLKVVEQNDAIFEQLDRPWYDPKPIDLNTLSDIEKGKIIQNIDRIISDEFSGDTIVIKDPRISRLFPLWAECLEKRGVKPICIIALRHPLEVAKSLSKRDGFMLTYSLELWRSYMLEAEFHTRGFKRGLVRYEGLLSNFRREIEALEQVLGLVGLFDVEKHEAAIENYLDAGMQHWIAEKDDWKELDSLHKPVSDLYKLVHDGLPQSPYTMFKQQMVLRNNLWDKLSPGPAESKITELIPENILSAAETAATVGSFDAAIVILEDAIKKNPRHDKFYLKLVEYLKHKGDLESALNIISQLAEISPQRGEVAIEQARIFILLGDHKNGLLAAARATQISPERAGFFHFYATQLLSNRDFEKAKEAVESAIEISPRNEAHWMLLARIHNKCGAFLQAKVAIENAISIENENPKFYYLYGNVLTKLGLLQDAKMAYKSAIKYAPDNGDYYIALGHLLNEIT